MDKAELEKEAKEYGKKTTAWLEDREPLDQRDIENAYLAGAEPREKQIAELKKQLDWKEKALSKAKEIIKMFVNECKMCRAYPEAKKMWYQEIAEAEQFLKDSEVEK